MAQIAELKGGRVLEHDIKFSADTEAPISGIVDGVQTITAAGQVTLSFDDSNTKLKSHILSIDPGGADRNVVLPAVLQGGDTSTSETFLSLIGRKLTIHNSADGYSEDLSILESDGTFIARVGFDSCVEIVFPEHGRPFCVNDLFVGTAVIPATGTTPVAMADAVGGGYVIIPEAVYITNHGTGTTTSRTFTVDQGTTAIAATAAVTITAKETILLPIGVSGTAVANYAFPANVAITIEVDGNINQSGARARLYYRVIKDAQDRLS